MTIEQLVRAENQQLAANQVSISNSINSLRLLSAMDWRTFVESMSTVEQVLLQDPADVYGRMDFATRDSYRHAVEKVAKSSQYSESDVARFAILLAKKGSTSKGSDHREAHVGYYLVDKGLYRLEHMAKAKFSTAQLLRKFSKRLPLVVYTGSIILSTLVFSGLLIAIAYLDGWWGVPLWLFGFLSLLCTSQLAIALVNYSATLITQPKLLPRMDFSQGIPLEMRSLVVIPTMLSGIQNVETLVKALEVRFLANQDDNLLFGLLTDFYDADTETRPEDEALVQLARQRIEELNKKYADRQNKVFYLFHRPRRWNAQDKKWMGYERKRGKLADLNGFLRGRAKDSFSLVVGDTSLLAGVKYVITLDTDTQLPRESASQFIGAMAHPLNKPQFDDSLKRVVAGYGILQPRMAISMSGANQSLYNALCQVNLALIHIRVRYPMCIRICLVKAPSSARVFMK